MLPHLLKAPSDWFGKELQRQRLSRRGQAGLLGKDRNSGRESEVGDSPAGLEKAGCMVLRRGKEPCGKMQINVNELI